MVVVSNENTLIPQDLRSVSINGATWWTPFLIIQTMVNLGLFFIPTMWCVAIGVSVSSILALGRKRKIYHAYKK